jgi:drug/metabolite transporter (DMT)-like permease
VTPPIAPAKAPSHRVAAWAQAFHAYGSALPAVWRGMLWVALSGVMFSILNGLLRSLTLHSDAFQAQFLRYLMGAAVMLPLLLKRGWTHYRPNNWRGQLWRGGVHSMALVFWFTALPHLALADMTAIGFTGPIFIMLGASWFLGERMRWDRWVAAGIGFAGVMVVVGPQLTGDGGYYSLVMLASAPMFAASFLITKTLTRLERSEVIVLWQSVAITLFSLPLGLLHWTPISMWMWLGFALSGVLGSFGHYCMARGFHIADISATQTLRFLDLVWASAVGWLMFGDVPTHTTLMGALVIFAATFWIAKREHRRQY